MKGTLERELQARMIERLNQDAARICARFELRYASIEAERPSVKRRYGVCYSDGRIRIRLRHATTGRPLKYSSLVNTLCHELAHLKHFNHGQRFKAFYLRLLEWARREAIYRPGRADEPVPPLGGDLVTAGSVAIRRRAPRTAARPGAPVQLGLFG